MFYYARFTKVKIYKLSLLYFFFSLKGPSQQYTPWLWDFSVSTYIYLMNLSRKTQSGEDLKMQSITNVAAQIVMQHSAVSVYKVQSGLDVFGGLTNTIFFLSNL